MRIWTQATPPTVMIMLYLNLSLDSDLKRIGQIGGFDYMHS